MNAKELADLIEREHGLYMTLDKLFANLRGKQLTEASKPIQYMLIRALRLLAAAEENDGTTPETDELVKFLERESGMKADTAVDEKVIAFIKTKERERNALAARVRELEADAERLKFQHSNYVKSCNAVGLHGAMPYSEWIAALDAARSK